MNGHSPNIFQYRIAPYFKCTQEHIRGTGWQFWLFQTYCFTIFFGQENLIYSSYHRNWTILVSPQYFGLLIDLNWRISCLCINFVPYFLKSCSPKKMLCQGACLLLALCKKSENFNEKMAKDRSFNNQFPS